VEDQWKLVGTPQPPPSAFASAAPTEPSAAALPEGASPVAAASTREFVEASLGVMFGELALLEQPLSANAASSATRAAPTPAAQRALRDRAEPALEIRDLDRFGCIVRTQ
jgi:hypothetical protein